MLFIKLFEATVSFSGTKTSGTYEIEIFPGQTFSAYCDNEKG